MGLRKIDRCPVPLQLVGDGDLYLLPSVVTNIPQLRLYYSDVQHSVLI